MFGRADSGLHAQGGGLIPAGFFRRKPLYSSSLLTNED
jgi:hypothetical protein